jgi:hypothetical protein
MSPLARHASPIADILTRSRLGCAPRPGSPGPWRDPGGDNADGSTFVDAARPSVCNAPLYSADGGRAVASSMPELTPRCSVDTRASARVVQNQKPHVARPGRAYSKPTAELFDPVRYLSRSPVSGITASPASAGLSRSTLARGGKANIAGRPIRAISGCEQSQQKNPYSITLLAWASTIDGNSMPRALAVLRLIARSNFTGACTGRSAGFAPLRIRST